MRRNQGLRINNIEKKLDKLKIYGDTYIKYTQNQSNHNGKTTLTTQIPNRTRLYVNGVVDDRWSYNVRIQNLSDLNRSDYTAQSQNDLKLSETYVSSKILGGTYAL
ncbi:hypothetical protein [Pelosinus fermentans]|uniref:TonB-dependent receptor n=1 Tax=Pelosinus fermentans JBW45 TaxID=1192197 RepID=I9DCJ3_9FIRM|nr:hypothetical protein [Pelosinus fermentans]AJQ26942.1 hypothetical protein JBW_01592 [Pelosinus fermentans JBW45]